MLPCHGILRYYSCPYYASGLCERPNCLFRHDRKDLKNEERPSPSYFPSKVSSSKESSEKAIRNKDKYVTPLNQSLPLPALICGKDIESPKRVNPEPCPVADIEVNAKRHKTDEDCLVIQDCSPLKDTSTVDSSITEENIQDVTQTCDNVEKTFKSKQNNQGSDADEAQSSFPLDSDSEEESPTSFHTEKIRDSSNKMESNKPIAKKKSNTETIKDSSSHSSQRQDSSESKPDKLDKNTTCQNSCQQLDNSDDKKGSCHEFKFPEDDDDDEDPIEVEKECRKMFEDYVPQKLPRKPVYRALFPESNKSPVLESKIMSRPKLDSLSGKEDEEGCGSVIGKRRLAHAGADQGVSTAGVMKDYFRGPYKLTLFELKKQMLQRIQAARKQEGRIEKVSTKNNSKPTEGIPAVTRKRIAHVLPSETVTKPGRTGQSDKYVSKLDIANIGKNNEPQEISTIAQTNTKGQTRVAHTPRHVPTQSSKTLITAALMTKIPLSYRQKILFQIHKECLKWFPPAKAVERAKKEEAAVASRCSSKMLYFSAATSVITKLRKDNLASTQENLIPEERKLSGSAGQSSWSIERNIKPSFPVGTELFKRLKKFLLTEEELELHGYPLPHPSCEPGRAVSKLRKRKPSQQKPVVTGIYDLNRRHCERCGKPYRTDPAGMPLVMEKCVYHFGKRFSKKTKGLLDVSYTCCDGEPTSEGCSVAPTHISAFPGSENNLTGFVTAVKDLGDDETMGRSLWDIIALDCEMVYTTIGSELARVTIVDSDKNTLYDRLVMPLHPILDYNTRFSGITEEMMIQGPTVSLIEVQAVLLTHLRPNSILIGHSLESDLHALKLIHRIVIDTSVLFPHRLGLPYKRALRTLSAEYCKEIIQSSVNGHNSNEDALAALNLVFYKVKTSA